MIVACPVCASRYVLPERLMGEGGARIRCPGCGTRFEAAPAAVGESGGGEGPAPPPLAPAPDPPRPSAEEIAREVLEERAASAPAVGDAHARGRLFSEGGEALIAALDAYRRRAGEGAALEPFRRALRERWGIDLGPRGGG